MKYPIFAAVLVALYLGITFSGRSIASGAAVGAIPVGLLAAGAYRSAPLDWGGGFAGGK